MKTIKHPPSIISIDTSVCIGVYDAYVYKYTNITNGKWYVGWHLGVFDGSYWHSSKNKEFLKIFSGSEAILTLEILSIGLRIDMKNLESKILTDQKVKKNSLSYNGAGSPTGNKETIDIDKCHRFVEFLKNKIKNGEVQEENFDTIKNLPRLQVRSKGENNEHISRIRDGMRETGLEKQNPILIWEGVEPKTKSDMIGNGNHTIKAIDGLLNITQAKTLEKKLNEISMNIDFVIFLDVKFDILEDRIKKRISESGDKNKRTDDNESTLIKRLDVYKELTFPIIKFYEEKGNLYKINGMLGVEDVNNKINEIIR